MFIEILEKNSRLTFLIQKKIHMTVILLPILHLSTHLNFVRKH
nr:MAG TPA: hypothetical protein [Caudoviricetes sp.]